MPRVVTAGVPTRMPEVTNGLLASKGIAFFVYRDAGLIQHVAASLR
jgi:hypothetical protein